MKSMTMKIYSRGTVSTVTSRTCTKNASRPPARKSFLSLAAFALVLSFLVPGLLQAQCKTADVVALDQVFFYNRLGAVNPAGMIFALQGDVVAISGTSPGPGNARLRDGKRPRPLVLRVNVGECLTVNFSNWLNPTVPPGVSISPYPGQFSRDEQPATRSASVHVMGMQLVGSIASDGSNVGQNGSSLVSPGRSTSYTFYAEREGGYLLYSTGATTGGEGDGGSLAAGLFGAVNVEPAGSEWYRSQVTADDLALAVDKTKGGSCPEPSAGKGKGGGQGAGSTCTETPGYTASGHPILNYDARYPADYPDASRRGLPILKLADGNKIVHSDLNAIITGAGRNNHSGYTSNPAYPDRNQPFREFTVIFHDEIMAVQAFPEFEDPVLGYTLHGVRDGFAINYGSGGAGAEILANRKGVGPTKNCVECKYEEFFLTSWALGDPAMVVDNPANSGIPATVAFYPDDPSNVHHSYMSDHVKFRNIHAGPKEHHVFHLHAHQWLHTPDSPNSAYLDSQAIGPGSSYTYEITYNGSGNRNKTVGDSIFHCHFYPHFAQGMWELWRVHDVFENGTRMLPDAEIVAGTPIPALVPIPTLAMAPMPTDTMPGYPFYVAGVAGHRPPHPPLDTVEDGGLPRHVITGGTAHTVVSRLDFTKELLTASAIEVPEDGTTLEKAAMAFHATPSHATYKPDGTPASFETNGLPPAPGAPYADPCRNDAGGATGTPRLYKAAGIQLDVKFNKAGWHFPQARMLSLWGDVAAFQSGTKAPEPFFFRANSGDCITYYHTNLVPGYYEQDDFQVRTPTDILGQHIHLVKFDVTSSDGSGNGWNYEDGTFSPDEVIERINAINKGNWKPASSGTKGKPAKVLLSAKPGGPLGTLGAQTTIQRWYADPVTNQTGQDRTLRTVYTHDHYGPSSHQQIGYYAGLLIEPAGSSWRDPETGTTFGTRFDGGPTSWRADILTANTADSYREFMFSFSDFVHAYRSDGTPVNPPARAEIGLPYLTAVAPTCPGGAPRPCPEAIAADDPGTMIVNYRQEPIALRVRDPQINQQAAGDAGDLAKVFLSNITRADSSLNNYGPYGPRPGVQPGDPFTPLMRAYENDKVQVRILVGGQEEGHNFSVHGVKWMFEPSDYNSGYRNSQMMGISEHFEFELPGLPVRPNLPFADYLYKPGSSTDDLWNGLWGILRAYQGGSGLQPDLLPLPNNPSGTKGFVDMCPANAPVREFSIAAVSAQQALGGPLVYNPRTANGGALNDPTALLYVRTSDLGAQGNLNPGVPIEPLILRANAGDCISLTLQNRLPVALPDLDGFFTLPMITENFNANQVKPSSEVGLHPQLLTYDVSQHDGTNVGFNPTNTAGPNRNVNYKWYAGNITTNPNGTSTYTPMEFGAINLMPTDPIKQPSKGLIGSLIIEPQGSTWVEDLNDSTKTRKTRDSATVTKADGTTFRDFALLFQNSVNLRYADGSPVPNLADEDDPEGTGGKAFNYRTEPLWKRIGFAPQTPLTGPTGTRSFDFTNVLSNSQVGGDPVTPIFTASSGQQVRFRVLHPGGVQRNNVFNLHGHVWQEEPYTNGSMVLGNNPFSQWMGSQMGIGPTSHFDFLLQYGAGGKNGVTGDYLYRDQSSFQFDGGLWGIFRVQ